MHTQRKIDNEPLLNAESVVIEHKTDWHHEFTSFLEAHCELGPDNFMSFTEFSTAFWSFCPKSFENMQVSRVNTLIEDIVKLLTPNIKLSGFRLPCGLEHRNTYLIGVKLITFPSLPERPAQKDEHKLKGIDA